jgi:putative membrane protein
MPRVMPITSALALATLTVASAALAQDTTRSNGSPWQTVGRDTNTTTSQPQKGTTPRTTTATATGAVVADSGSIRQAVDEQMLEIRLGELAQSRAADTAVKNFGQRMVTDHSSMNQQWTTLARNNRISTGTDLNQGGRATVARLEGLSGATFDRAYMQRMIQGHQQDLSAFRRMASVAESPEVRQLASTGVTAIQQHLTLAQQINSRLGTTSTAGVPPRSPTDTANRNTGNNGDQLRGADRAFVQNTLQDHLMHVQLAERTQREAKNEQTRRLAERIEKDFVSWGQRWRELADRSGLQPASHLGKNHQDKVNQLQKASKNNFDRTYVTLVTQHLESVVPYFEKEGHAVQSDAVRRLVKEELPVVREDLNQARRLEGQSQANAQAKSKDKDKAK